MAFESFRNLDVWQKSMTLTEAVYRLSDKLPNSERYGLISQIQRCSVSIPCNLAEGYGASEGNFLRHVRIARGSLMELETQLELCVRLNLIERDDVVPIWQESQVIGKMLTKLVVSLSNT
ncbi:four helix bundle protein [Lacunimicrobium album]